MTKYTVVGGDNLWSIATRFKTTMDIILQDNTFITDRNLLQIGWELTIRTPDEVAREKASNAQAAAAASTQVRNATPPPANLTRDDARKPLWDGAEVLGGQTGRVRILKTIPVVARLEDGTFKEKGILPISSTWRTFEHITGDWWTYLDGPNVHIMGLYNLGGNAWVYDLPGYVQFETVPAAIAGGTSQPSPTTQTATTISSSTPTIPSFDPRKYSRPVLQIKKNNSIITMELRVLNSGGSNATQIQQNRTNGGWFINVAGSSLPVKTISGFFLDTATNHEFDEFMANYAQYLTAYRDGDYNSSAICSLYYKGREYKGLIAAFNYSDEVTDHLLYRFTLQMVVLKEKGPESKDLKIPVPGYSKWDIANNPDFKSDLRYLLIDPITGLYGKDSSD